MSGRTIYDGFVPVWPQVKDSEGFADRMNRLPKYIPSKTLKKLDWNNSTLITGDLIEATKTVKASTKGDILIYGSASIVHPTGPRESD